MQPYEDNDLENDPIKKLLMLRQGGSVSNQDLADQEERQKQALNLAQAGTLGSIGNVGTAAEKALPDLVQRIKAAAQANPIKVIPSEYDAAQTAAKEAVANAPSLWQKYGPKDVNVQNQQMDPEKFKQLLDLLKK